uniref:Uncharacterized protein n=1 Tax=Knipowitschia caucasica TaxID=637954 RepID=A0AAV2KUC7_KNICA
MSGASRGARREEGPRGVSSTGGCRTEPCPGRAAEKLEISVESELPGKACDKVSGKRELANGLSSEPSPGDALSLAGSTPRCVPGPGAPAGKSKHREIMEEVPRRRGACCHFARSLPVPMRTVRQERAARAKVSGESAPERAESRAESRCHCGGSRGGEAEAGAACVRRGALRARGGGMVRSRDEELVGRLQREGREGGGGGGRGGEGGGGPVDAVEEEGEQGRSSGQ